MDTFGDFIIKIITEENRLDDVYREWFDFETVSVSIELENSEDFLTALEIAELTGAPKKSRILVKRDDRVIAFIVSNDIFSEDMYRYLVDEPSGLNYYLQNSVLVLKEEYTKKGIGPRCVIKEIHAATQLASELPIRCIKVDAIGNYESFHWKKDPMRGYYVWAKMGFNGRIPAATLKKLSTPYQKCEFVSELMLDEGGRKEWFANGDSIKLEFDLRPNSVSWKILNQYMDEHGIEL